MAVAVVVVVGAGAWWFLIGQHAGTPSASQQATSTPSGPNTSDQSIAQDAAAVKAQVAAIPTASTTSELPAQVAATQTAADQLANLALKFSMRIGGLGTTSPMASTTAAVLSDLNAKLADAHTQASAALGHIANATASDASMSTTASEYAKTKADMHVAAQDFAAALTDIDTLMQALSIAPAPAGVATSSVQMGVVELR